MAKYNPYECYNGQPTLTVYFRLRKDNTNILLSKYIPTPTQTKLFKLKKLADSSVVISPLHGGRLTSQPLSQLTGPPSLPACHFSWSNRTAPSSGLALDLTHTHTHIQMHTHITALSKPNIQCFLQLRDVFLVITVVSRTIHQAGNWPLIVRVGEKHQLLVDKVVVGKGFGGLTI